MHAPINEAIDDFYEELKAVFGNMPCRDVKNEMEDMNAKVGTDNTNRQGSKLRCTGCQCDQKLSTGD